MLMVPLATLLVVVSLSSEAAPPSIANEQKPAAPRAQTTGAVTVAAPVYLLPDSTRTPLRTLPAGTLVTVGEVRPDWVQITFNDGVLGARTAWIERRFITISDRTAAPDPTRPGPAIPPTAPKPSPTKRPPARPAPISPRAFASVMFDRMSASESFNAVTGKDGLASYGAGVQVANIAKGLFVEASIERSTVDGERVFVFEDEVFRLGIPLEIEMMPIDLVVGWRSLVVDRVSAYGGAGVTFLTYKESSDFSDADENIDERYTGFVVMGGIEYGVAKWVHLRTELRYRRVGDVLGVGGASAAFDETTLGGIGGGIKVVVGR
jgi:hypothetical protein